MKTYEEALAEFEAADTAATGDHGWLERYSTLADEITESPNTLDHLIRIATRRGLLTVESTAAEISTVTTVLLQVTICAIVIGIEMEKHD